MNEELLANEELLSLISAATALSTAAIVVLAVVGLALFVCLYIVLPIMMAKSRGRSAFGWMLLFWFFSPIYGVIALRILGDSNEKLRREILEEVRQQQLNRYSQV